MAGLKGETGGARGGMETVGGLADSGGVATYHAAQYKQRLERLEADYRAGRVFPEPDRITMVLDARGLDGPEVDEACGAKEPAVDQWEAGTAVPTWEQLSALAELTGFTVDFLMREPDVRTHESMWMCGRGGCQSVEARTPVPRYNPDQPLARVYPLLRV